MKYIDIENEITLLEGANNFDEAGKIIFRSFCIDKIVVFTKHPIENSTELNGNNFDIHKILDSVSVPISMTV